MCFLTNGLLFYFIQRSYPISGPFPLPLQATDRQFHALETIIRRHNSPQKLVWRAKIVIYALDGQTNEAISQSVGKTEKTVRTWRFRWFQAYEAITLAETCGDVGHFETLLLETLSDKARSGSPLTYTAEQICQIIAVSRENVRTCGYPLSHWTPAILRLEIIKRGLVDDISVRTIGRFLKEAALTPSQLRYWEFPDSSDTLEFREETKRVCQTYADAPALAEQGIHTVSVDEKTAIQAKGEPYPTLPMKENQPERQEFTYTRHGTLTLIGSFDVVTGQVMPSIGPTRTEADFLDHIKKRSLKTNKPDGCL